jgi:hypothetical protein
MWKQKKNSNHKQTKKKGNVYHQSKTNLKLEGQSEKECF